MRPLSEKILIEARTLIGSEFHWHQRGPVAYDCLGVILAPLKAVGIVPEEFEFLEYGNRPGNDLIPALTGVGAQWLETTSVIEDGDILSFYVGRHVSHLGWLDQGHLIHADLFRGVIREPLQDFGLKRAINFRVRGE